MPGTFLRIGDYSQIHMIAPSLTNSQVELVQGEAILEVIGLMHGSSIEVRDQGALIWLEKDGLYRMTAGTAPTAAVIAGSAQVTLLDRTIKLGKGRQTMLAGILQSEKFDRALDDELFAWSSVRSQYEAAASYDAATRMAQAGQYGALGWYFNDVLDCWAWLPFGRFFSPFGWGFYSPVTVGGATVVKCTVVRGGHWPKGPHKPIDGTVVHEHWVGLGTTRTVAINPTKGMVAVGRAHTGRQASAARSGSAGSAHSFSGGGMHAGGGGHR